MGSLLALLIIVLASLLIVRIGTNALILTGMSLSASRFQAASAFFGVGFTTSESEMVVGHEVRRKIILHLIIAGNIGLTSAMATLIITFIDSGGEGMKHLFGMLGLIVAGIAVLYVFSLTDIVKKPLDALMKYSLERAGVVRAMDYELLLNVEDGFCISDFRIREGHPLADKALSESRPSQSGIVVLAVRKQSGEFVGAPDKDQIIRVNDVVMIYGSEDSVDKMVHPEQ
ncbi:potassium transporter TrkA [Oceaniferula spumae]|uniref:Potassium transporter TrkA n=1 Tax=Oceaniferula spumae TaxID=2979115 RepID=A0AAT9FPR4_9BACT